VRLTKKVGVEPRQSYRRVGKLALIQHKRYPHAHEFKRANRSLRKLKTYLGRVMRDIGRRIAGDDALEEVFARELSLARRVLAQDRHQRGRKVYSLHAPEVDCIGSSSRRPRWVRSLRLHRRELIGQLPKFSSPRSSGHGQERSRLCGPASWRARWR
jgi:hypothetical protein